MSNIKTLWVVGIPTDCKNWMAEGIYTTEDAAALEAYPGTFIVEVEINKPFPKEAEDAIKLYFPSNEIWEESALYKLRNPKLEVQ